MGSNRPVCRVFPVIVRLWINIPWRLRQRMGVRLSLWEINYDEGEGVEEHCISSDGFFEMEELPKAAVVVGAGYIAVDEFICLYCWIYSFAFTCKSHSDL